MKKKKCLDKIVWEIQDLKMDIKWLESRLERSRKYSEQTLDTLNLNIRASVNIYDKIHDSNAKIKELRFAYYLRHGSFPDA